MKIFTRLALTIITATFVPMILIFLTLQNHITFLGGNILLAAMGALLLAGNYLAIVRPVNKLKKAARRIKDGDLDFSIDVETNDEIGELTQDFEEMRIRLRESQEDKISSDESLKELISNIAHDLKTPITTIKGYSEGILDGVASTPEMQEKYIRTIYNKAEDMASLIEELTFYSKIDANRIPYHFSKLSARAYFDDCAYDMGMDAEGRGISFTYSCRVSPEVMVIADPEQLNKVLNNLFSNSVKYMVREPKAITMEVKDIGDFIQCDFTDSGKGVSRKELGMIFDRFYRTDASRNTGQGGSGIGLSIAKKIVEDHGGQIWASCEEGQGLSIHIILRKYIEVESNE